jgi:hypothetical protein
LFKEREHLGQMASSHVVEMRRKLREALKLHDEGQTTATNLLYLRSPAHLGRIDMLRWELLDSPGLSVELCEATQTF